ncbi:LysR family transcriptional regulator [Photobacterium swingsii]|uniref:LysR family transcriptional regulator n=1 Tax=Photobacterium swingsii TaxID=680026 RepID=UPI0040690155
MNLEQLSAFVAAADTGSFSAAGRLVKKTPAAISQLIANLEIDFNLSLFDRTGRYPSLTSEGLSLYDYAKRIVELSADMERKVASYHKQQEDLVTIGIEGCISHFVIPNLLTAFSQHFPEVRLKVTNLDSNLLRRAVSEGSIDIGIGFWDMKENLDYQSYTLKPIDTTVVVSPKHALAGKRVTFDELCHQRQLLLPVNRSYDSAILSVNRWEMDNLPDLVAGVEAGMGWSALPFICVQDAIKNGTLVELRDVDFGRSTEAIYIEMMSSKMTPPGPATCWLKDTISEMSLNVENE